VSAENSTTFLISIFGKDQVGVVSSVTGQLFEVGANLADSSFAVLGEGFEFSTVAAFEGDVSAADIESGLTSLDLLDGAQVSVTGFHYDISRGDSAEITHLVEISGGDRPGLVARMSDVLVDYGANIVRMSSRRVDIADGTTDYRTRFAIHVAGDRFQALEAALANTAGSLRLQCRIDAIR